MDFDGSLTPPLSPGLMDSEPFEASPVLLGKHHGNQQTNGNIETIDRTEKKSVEYDEPTECQPSIFGRSYSIDSPHEDTHIGQAQSYWNGIPIVELGDFHVCDECQRSVMDQKRCLKSLDDVNQAQNIFYEAIMKYQDLEDCAKEWIRCTAAQSSQHITVARKYRKLVNETLSFVCEYVRQLCERDESCFDAFVNIVNLMVMTSMQSQDILMGGLRATIREDIETAEFGRRMKTSPVCELLHTNIDICTSLLKILLKMCNNSTVMNYINEIIIRHDNQVQVVDKEFTSRVIKCILSQIMKISIEKYTQLLESSKDEKGHFLQVVLFSRSPFPCLCVQKLASLCLHVAAKMRQYQNLTQGDLDSMDTQTNMIGTYNSEGNSLDNAALVFWKMLQTYMNAVIQDAQNKKPNDNFDDATKGAEFQRFDSVQDALSFCWWWTWHAAHLFLFDSSGKYQAKLVTSSSCVPLLGRLLRLSLTSCDGNPRFLASHLICYQAISSFWRNSSPTPEIVSSGELAHCYLLWAHFSKKLNTPKKSDKLGTHKYAVKDDKNVTPNFWIVKCEKYLRYEKGSLASENEKSLEDPFKVFLSIFGELLHIGCWSAIRDRFFSRLSPGEIKNLSDIGLPRLIRLFLIVALSKVSNDERLLVFSKLLEHLNGIYLSRTDYRKQKVLLNGLFASMLISIRFCVKLQPIAAKCGKTASLLLKLYSESAKDMDQRNSLWKIIIFYFQNLTELVQSSSSFDFFQHLLIPSIEMQSIIPNARTAEISVISKSLRTIISSLSSHARRSPTKDSFCGCVTLCGSICKCFLSWMKEIAELEDCAAEEIVNTVNELCNFLVTTSEKSSDAQSLPTKLVSLIEHFGCSIKVKLRARFLFLVGILSEDSGDLLDFLNKRSPNSSASRLAIIQGVIKCIVSHPNKKDQNHLVRCLVSLQEVKEVILHGKVSGNFVTFGDFLHDLETRYNSTSDFAERKRQTDQVSSWFNALGDVIRAFAKSYAVVDNETVMNIYQNCGRVAQHCYGMLYSRGSSGIITQIFDFIVLPRWIYLSRDKNIHPAVLKALTCTLHMFIKSLLSIESPGDNYIKRVVSDLISLYLTRFPAASNAASHPFCRALADSNLTTYRRSTLLKNLQDACLKGPDTDTKLTVIIEILYCWSEKLMLEPSREESIPILPLLERARTTLGYLPALMYKVDKLYAFCKC